MVNYTWYSFSSIPQVLLTMVPRNTTHTYLPTYRLLYRYALLSSAMLILCPRRGSYYCSCRTRATDAWRSLHHREYQPTVGGTRISDAYGVGGLCPHSNLFASKSTAVRRDITYYA